jgi:hypothetical protein
VRSAFGCLGLGLLALGLAGPARAASTNDAVFPLREVSAFEEGGSAFTQGQQGPCQDKPFPEVKAYPHFTSQKPVYGSVLFHERKGATNSSLYVYFAVDESQGTGKGYDRLYIDRNRDLDLRNDPVLKPTSERLPGAELRWSNIRQQVLFENLTLNFDCGSAGIRPVTLLPRLVCSHYGSEDYNQMFFVRTRLQVGRIELVGEEFRVRLGNTRLITGRLDEPSTTLELTPQGGGSPLSWWGGDSLSAAHRVWDRFFTFSTSPAGDQLTVHPYHGELGKFEVGPGARQLEKVSLRGSLRSTNLAVAVGGDLGKGWPEAVRSCQVPVGDYMPSYLTIEFGRLQIELSDNYHAEGNARGRGGRAPVYGLAVRKDKPCVVDFSNPPDVMFTSPTNTQQVRLGEELQVKAVLVDPKLDIMIRGLEDTTRNQTNGPDGKPLGYSRHLSLDPTVLITRANGEKVAEGVMPFG